MLEQEFQRLLLQIQSRKCEEQTVEVKSAARGCPERLYDTFSSFSNQDDGGILVFGLDEKAAFKKVGVYNAQDLQKRLMEIGEEMTPVVRPILSVFDEEGLVFVTAEIPPVALTERPCFKAAKGRLKGSYVRVGDGDKPMTEYEVYSYEAFRKKNRDDLRPVEEASLASLDQSLLEQYLLQRRLDHPNLASVPIAQFYELAGVTRNGQLTMASVLLFSPLPQAYFPQLTIHATRVPGTELGPLDQTGQRFSDSKRMEGTLPEMLESAMSFVRSNMRMGVRIDPNSGKRTDLPEYPLDAVREALLNALIHRDYSVYTENMPIRLMMFSDRMEIHNPGGLYGRLTIDGLGMMQPDTRNPFLVTAMETLSKTENRYSGIPRMVHAMKEVGLPAPVFSDSRGEFSVTFYNIKEAERNPAVELTNFNGAKMEDPKGLLPFCEQPRNRKEIAEFLGIASAQYAMRRYVEPLVKIGVLRLSIPQHPKSPRQTYQTMKNEGTNF